MELDGLPLAYALSALRAEVRDAIENAEGEDLQFTLDKVELELQMIVTTKGAANLGGSLWRVVTAGASVERSAATTHRVALTLVPDEPGKGNGHKTNVSR